MACIRKRRGTFVVDWRDGAGRRRWQTCSTREEAKAALAQALRETEQALRPGTNTNVTLDAYAAKWLEQVEAVSKERTWEIYSSTYRCHIAPVLGGRKVRTITRAHVRAFLVDKFRVGLDGRLVKQAMSALMALAVDDGIIVGNPTAGLGKSLRLSKKPVDADGEEVRALDRAQLDAFLGAVPARDMPLFMTLARTGLRVGEAVALQSEDLDLNNATARICRNISRGRQGSPKGGRARSVDLSPELVDVLRRHLLARKRAALESGRAMPLWVFVNSAGKPMDDGKIRHAMTRTLKAAGLPVHYTPHALRHTFASILISEGESPAWVSRQLGHASVTTTLNIYGRWLPPVPVRGGVARLDAASGSSSGSKIALVGGQVNCDTHIERTDRTSHSWRSVILARGPRRPAASRRARGATRATRA